MGTGIHPRKKLKACSVIGEEMVLYDVVMGCGILKGRKRKLGGVKG